MALTNYTNISAKAVEWLNRTGSQPVSDNLEDFFLLTHNKMVKDAPINGIEEVATLSVDAESETAPTGLTEVISMWLVGDSYNTPLSRSTLDQVLRYQEAGNPCQFAHVAGNLYFGPTPSEAVDVRIHYYANPTVLSSTNATNWYSNNAPELVLAGVLFEAYMFLKDDERAKYWKSIYDEQIAMTELASWRADAPLRRIRNSNLESDNWSP